MAPSPPVSLTGRCACGLTTWTSTTLPTTITYCHCTTCRRLSGADRLPFGDFPLSSITWTSPPPTTATSPTTPPLQPAPHPPSLQTFTLSTAAERGKCAECGTPLFMRYYCEPDVVGVCMGTMDTESVRGEMVKPSGHIFTSQRVPWCVVGGDGLQWFERYRPGFREVLDGWVGERGGGDGGGGMGDGGSGRVSRGWEGGGEGGGGGKVD